MWDVSNPAAAGGSGLFTGAANHIYDKGERAILSRRCRFPAIKPADAVDNSAPNFVLLITEYYNEVKSGFMRIKLKADYTISSNNQEEERVQTTHDFRYTSAYYPTTQLCYSVAVDQADG